MLQDMSAPSIYPSTVVKMCLQLGKEGSEESALIKFVFKSVMQAGCRSSEISHVVLDSMRFDIHFKCVVGELPQLKTGKMKLFSFMAGVDRGYCWFLDFADFLCLVDRPVYEEEEVIPIYSHCLLTLISPCDSLMRQARTKCVCLCSCLPPFHPPPHPQDEETGVHLPSPSWLIPALNSSKTPGTKIGNWIKDLGSAGREKYSAFRVSELPLRTSAAGIRHGETHQRVCV